MTPADIIQAKAAIAATCGQMDAIMSRMEEIGGADAPADGDSALEALEAEFTTLLHAVQDGEDKARARWERLMSAPGRRTPDEMECMRHYVRHTPGRHMPRAARASV